MVFLARISECALIDLGEDVSGLVEFDDSLASQLTTGVCLHLLAWTFHPVKWLAGIDSMTGI